MKRLITCLSILLSTTTLIGQMGSSIDILGGFSSTFRSIDGNGSNTELVRNDTELNKGNIHVGFNYNKRIGEKMHFKTGVRYMSMGYKTKERTLTFGDMMTTTNLYFTYDYQFIEVPLNIRYELGGQKKIVPYVELGVSPMYLFGNVQVLYQDGEQDTRTRNPSADFNKLHVALNANVGINYVLSGGGTALFLQGIFRYDLINLVDSENFKEFLYGYGLEIGARRSISLEN